MNSANHLKKQHEKFVCDTLVRVLGLNAIFERYGNDLDEPDCIYKVDGNLLGIEVATAYYRDIDAKQKWTLARKERKFPLQGYEWRWGGPIKNAGELMRRRIENEIKEKCSKKYCGAKEIWLCIQETADLSDERTIRNWLQSIKIPEKHYFDAIYLLHHAPTHEGGDYKAFKMWPCLMAKKDLKLS